MKYLKKILPEFLKTFIRVILAHILRRTTKPKPKGQICKSDVVVLSDGQNPTFFGYHDKTPFSLGGSKILAMSITASDTKPESECTPMKIGYFRKANDGEFENTFIPFAETTTWCFQQGCMLQWHPLEPDRHVFFNALVDGGYGSKVVDVETGEELRTYPNPIYSLDPTGKLAATLNFSRLGRLRPGYGYPLLPDKTQKLNAPEDEGLFIFDLGTGKKKLLVSLADLAREAGDKDSQHYINHATFSPNGKRIVFFHLWAHEGAHGRELRVCAVDVETGRWHEIESERTVSHYCWRDAHTLLATTREKSGKWHYTLYNLVANTRNDLDLPFDSDGHPMFHPLDKNIIVTDTYPDLRRDQHIFIVNLDKRERHQVATFYSPFKYRGQVRCDLHPRWDLKRNLISIDCIQNNKRCLRVKYIEHCHLNTI